MTPTQRSIAKLRSEGWLVALVERWNPYARVRQDLFGFIDILAIKGNTTLGVQTTTGSNVSKRVAKIRETQAADVWLESPHRQIIVHGWAKRGPRGKRKVWTCLETRLERKAKAGAITLLLIPNTVSLSGPLRETGLAGASALCPPASSDRDGA